jgi:Ca2+/H+ antiporter, TMEM165/GDT1 family
MIADVPATLPGNRLPTKPVQGIAAVMFVILGTMALFGIGV